MQITPYFPEPPTVEACVASEPYDVRLGFIRRVVAFHFGTVCLVAVAALAPLGITPSSPVVIVALGLLVLLSLSRMLQSKSRKDWYGSSILFPVFLISLGVAFRGLFLDGWPVLGLGIAGVCAFIYTSLCGRDFSFVGLFFLSSLGTIASLLLVTRIFEPRPSSLGLEVACSVGYLCYYANDLAWLQSRRRLGEEYLATVDLYRDILNFTTYWIQVIRHWRTFRI